jgi:hypothetical protein
MVKLEDEILRDLIHRWIPLGLEYCQGAPGITTLFVYAGSELGGQYANIFYEQNGEVLYPDHIKGGSTNPSEVVQMQKLLLEDLDQAESEFTAASIPCPTEYRITYEPNPGRLDMQISRELKYVNHPTKVLEDGPEDWLDGRLEKQLGNLMPTEEQRREWQ